MIVTQSQSPTSTIFLQDCVEGMKRYADNHFDLAIVETRLMGLG